MKWNTVLNRITQNSVQKKRQKNKRQVESKMRDFSVYLLGKSEKAGEEAR